MAIREPLLPPRYKKMLPVPILALNRWRENTVQVTGILAMKMIGEEPCLQSSIVPHQSSMEKGDSTHAGVCQSIHRCRAGAQADGLGAIAGVPAGPVGGAGSAHLYLAHADATDNELAKKVLLDIANEERVHNGEFQRLISILSQDEEAFLAEGAEEVNDMAAGREPEVTEPRTLRRTSDTNDRRPEDLKIA